MEKIQVVEVAEVPKPRALRVKDTMGVGERERYRREVEKVVQGYRDRSYSAVFTDGSAVGVGGVRVAFVIHAFDQRQ